MSSGEERWRCFVALDVGEPARSAVVEYLDRLRTTVAGVAWTSAGNLHVTLKFLGDVPVARIPGLTERRRRAVSAEPAFALQVGGVGAFPSLARPQALWIGIGSARIGSLAAAVETACVEEGFEPERRRFHPHLTLGRVWAR